VAETAAESGPPPAEDALGWSDLAPRLKLDSLARQVVLNSVVTEYADGKLQLALLPEMEWLVKPEIRDAICAAIEAELGVSLDLDIRSRDALPWETPEQAGRRQAEQRRQRVIEAIRQDPVVNELQRRFDAELVETSVRELTDETR